MIGLTAFIPAIVGILNGIHFQSESRRLFVRSQLMTAELETCYERIAGDRKKISANTNGSDFNTVLILAENTTNILTDEVAEWSLIYEKRVYDQG
ncbi:MAG TPA: hypothetical protein VFP97_12200 [Chitinophagaceae bacterium]|nr:hypothetical protein [Chitinophagaceae bacterium]